MVLFLCSCHQPSIEPKGAVTEKVTLPFFNQADWTPEWIDVKDSNYARIHRIPAFSFTNQEGKLITEASVAGKIYVANFFFSRCSNICPKMTTNMQLLQDAFRDDEQIMLLSHSVTPDEDSVPVLAAYAAENKIDARKWNLLTGEKNELYRLAKKEYFAGDSVGYFQTGNEFLHTENFILVDGYRRIRGVYNGTLGVEIERMIKDIEVLKSES
jgi:protein SCO1/2